MNGFGGYACQHIYKGIIGYWILYGIFKKECINDSQHVNELLRGEKQALVVGAEGVGLLHMSDGCRGVN